MKKNKKDGLLTINPIKIFKRYLKENGIYAMYLKYTSGKGSITERLKNNPPETYFSTEFINRDKCKNNQNSPYAFCSSTVYSVQSNFSINSIKWKQYIKYEINKKEYIELFKKFLKKRGIYDLYQSCFAPYYVNGLRSGMRGFEVSPKYTITQWEDLYPNKFICSAFDYSDTIKPKHFWEKLDVKWQKELRLNSQKIKYIYNNN